MQRGGKKSNKGLIIFFFNNHFLFEANPFINHSIDPNLNWWDVEDPKNKN